MGPVGCLETVVTNYQQSLCNIPEECKPPLVLLVLQMSIGRYWSSMMSVISLDVLQAGRNLPRRWRQQFSPMYCYFATRLYGVTLCSLLTPMWQPLITHRWHKLTMLIKCLCLLTLYGSSSSWWYYIVCCSKNAVILKRVKLSLSMPWRHTERAEVFPLSFLISALGVDEWSTWCPR
jgi:hypothetical protein